MEEIRLIIKRVALCALSLVLLSACEPAVEPVLYTAKQIITMHEPQPQATAIVVDNGRVVALGSKDKLLLEYANIQHNKQFENAVLLPGLIDPHIHMILGAIVYSRPFIPPWDMVTHEGLIKGVEGKEGFLSRLSQVVEEHSGDDSPLVIYGYHNLVHGDLFKEDIDAISIERPILIWHYSVHDFYLNSAALEWAGLNKQTVKDWEGVVVDDQGELSGRIYEHGTQKLFEKLGPVLLTPGNISKGYNGFETLLARSGVTTVAELGYGLFGKGLEDTYNILEYTKEDPYHLYLVPEHRAFYAKYGEDSAQTILNLAAKKTSKGDPVVLPQVKFFSDAAFYSQTMRMRAPGYIGGQSKGSLGVWATQPELIEDQIQPYWDAGIDIHIHSNGDAAQDVTIKVMQNLSAEKANRFIVQHAGLLLPAQLDALAAMDSGISAASHYVHYMGEDYRSAIGDKVEHITPLNSAARRGIPVTLHSDAPLAPPVPLKAAAEHMTRSTRQGTIVNEAEKLSAYDALKSITLDAAWTLGLEDEIGSIAVGKRADFTVVDRNPLTTPAQQWAEIGIKGVFLAGDWRPVITEIH